MNFKSILFVNYMLQQLHSEYRSTYTWHEYTGPHQEHTVVRRAPPPSKCNNYNIIALLFSLYLANINPKQNKIARSSVET